jgi:hypothetical protein
MTALALGGWLRVVAQPTPTGYPRLAGYFSVVHPLVNVYAAGASFNFSPAYAVGFPTGLNLLKSDRFGFSFEITPFVRVEGGQARMYNLLFHPGAMFRFPRGFTINARLAFETAGRFGVTPVLSQVIRRGKNSSLFLAMPLPVRLGNDRPASVGAGLQVGIAF